MKRTVKVKNLITLAAVLILLLSITAVPAYAAFPTLDTAGRRLGAFLLSAIQAINITLTSTAAQSTGADIMNYISDPMNLTYSYSEMWEDQPKIQIWPDYVTIDGVDYTDVWISNEAATKFQVDAYDFKTAYSIASNTNGTFASGTGYVDDEPIYLVNGQYRTRTYTVPAASGTYDTGIGYTHIQQNGNYYKYGISNTEQSAVNWKYQNPDTYYPLYCYTYANNPSTQGWTYMANWGPNPPSTFATIGNIASGPYIASPFDFDYVSGNIPAQRVLNPDEGLMLRIPSDRIPAINDFVTDYPEFVQPDGAPIDVDIDPDIMTKLDDLIDIIAPIIPIIQNGDIQFTVNHNEPTPPVPDTPIVDATVPQVVNPIINEITNYGDQITEQIPQIIETIPNITEICENIDTAPYHDLDTGLDHLPSFFLPFITDLRSALGIWHYVTEWLAQISTTFAFVTGCLVGTSIMTPIYAAIAGFMCIKIYRRMTA